MQISSNIKCQRIYITIQKKEEWVHSEEILDRQKTETQQGKVQIRI